MDRFMWVTLSLPPELTFMRGFKRMQGYNVLWPWGWHWTGQPLLGASQRVAKGDEAYIRVLREVDGVPEAELQEIR